MKKLFLLSLILLFTGLALAKPNKSIKEMMDTPISAFDFFLYQLYDSTKCDSWPGFGQFTPSKCMTAKPEYDDENGSITLRYRIALSTNDDTDMEYFEIFMNASEEKREKMHKENIYYLLYQLGLRKHFHKQENKSALNYPRGWIDGVFLPKQLKKKLDKVKDQIILYIRFSYGNNLMYTGKRDKDGVITIEKFDFESTIPDIVPSERLKKP
jgi:hypothetical protein